MTTRRLLIASLIAPVVCAAHVAQGQEPEHQTAAPSVHTEIGRGQLAQYLWNSPIFKVRAHLWLVAPQHTEVHRWLAARNGQDVRVVLTPTPDAFAPQGRVFSGTLWESIKPTSPPMHAFDVGNLGRGPGWITIQTDDPDVATKLEPYVRQEVHLVVLVTEHAEARARLRGGQAAGRRDKPQEVPPRTHLERPQSGRPLNKSRHSVERSREACGELDSARWSLPEAQGSGGDRGVHVYGGFMISTTEEEIDHLANVLKQALDGRGAEDLDYARLVLALNTGGPVMQALRARIIIDDEQAVLIISRHQGRH